MAVKFFNNIIKPNELIPILFVFGVYLRILIKLPLLILILKRAAVYDKVKKKLRKLQFKKMV